MAEGEAAEGVAATVERIAVATDCTEGGRRAEAWARRSAAAHGADLVVVSVVGDGDAAAERRRQLRADHPDATIVVSVGDEPAEAIVAAAAQADATLLVVGSSGMRGRKEFLLGNVANHVTHLSRCSVVVVNTTDEIPAEEAEPSGLGARGDEIARTLGPVVLDLLRGRALHRQASETSGGADGPRQLREALEELGPTFGKLGQMLSTRPDLVSDEYRAELAKLQSDVPPMTEAEVVGAMEQALGVPWEDVFATIDPEPLAAGTIGQVHRATLAGGRRVVVKVQRPDAAPVILRDLELLEKVVAGIGRSGRVRRIVDLPSMVDQVASAMRAELDFTLEARNLHQMGRDLANYPRIAVPECLDDLTSPRLLVMEEVIDAVPLDEAPPSEERTAAAQQLLHAFYQQVLENGLFHADPHPGNLLWSDGRIWLIDLGMVGTLDATTRQQLIMLLLAFANGDVDLVTDVALDLAGGGPANLDVATFRADLASLMEDVTGASLDDLDLIELLNTLTAISVRHGVPLPADIVLMGKALTQAQLTVTSLDPTLDPLAEARRFFVRSVNRRVAKRLDPQAVLYEAEKLRYRFGQVSEALATAAGTRTGRGLEVRFTSERLERTVQRAGRTVALGLSTGLCWIAATVASGSDRIDPRTAKALRMVAGGLSVGLAAELGRSDR